MILAGETTGIKSVLKIIIPGAARSIPKQRVFLEIKNGEAPERLPRAFSWFTAAGLRR